MAIGKIVKVHGLKGAVKVTPYLESNKILEDLKEVQIGLDKGPEPFKIIKSRLAKKAFFIELEGVKDVATAGKLVGRELLIPSDRLEPLPENEYYWKDIIGLKVRTEAGEFLGKIETVFNTGSNDVYVCRGEEREILLPATAEVIRKIDLEKGEMIVRLLEGL